PHDPARFPPGSQPARRGSPAAHLSNEEVAVTVKSQGALFPQPRGEQETLPLPDGEQDQIDPLDAPQHFADATSYEVRDKLVDYIRRDLLGPWEGEYEEFPPKAMGPRERYLVGMLGPKPNPNSGAPQDAVDVDAVAEGHPVEGDLPE